MSKKIIRLTENDLHRIVRRSVNRIMNEEWESPLDKAKKNRNDFDNVKKIDVSKFQKKPKKSKKGTLEDLPSFEKLKGLKFENRINRIVKESMNRVLRESVPGGMEVTEENIDSVIGNICESYGCEYSITGYPEFLCVELNTSFYKPFNACTDALAEAFGRERVTGDSFMNSIYVNY